MKKIITVFCFLLLVIGCVPVEENPSSPKLFNREELNIITVENSSSEEIFFLFISPDDSSYWGFDTLSSNVTLASGESRTYNIHYSDSSDEFSLLMINADGYGYQRNSITIADGTPAVIEVPNNAVFGIDSDVQYIDLSIANDTGEELLDLFLSPSDSRHYGVSFISTETPLQNNGTLHVLIPVDQTSITYDVMAVNSQSEIYAFTLTISSVNGFEQNVAIEESDQIFQ